MGCWGCSMFRIWDVGMCYNGNVRSLRCGVLRMWVALDVEFVIWIFFWKIVFLK